MTEIGKSFESEYRKELVLTGADVTLEMIKTNKVEAMQRIEVWLREKNMSLTDAVRELNCSYVYVTDVWRRVTKSSVRV